MVTGFSMSIGNGVFSHLLPEAGQEAGKSHIIKEAIPKLALIVERLEKTVPQELLAETLAFYDRLGAFSTRLALVGRAKTGKTSLANALIGRPGLLPSDPDPWTSVTNTLHINQQGPGNASAVFTLYNAEEWSGMFAADDRISKTKKTENFAVAFDEMQDQVRDMQARAKLRLGRNFKRVLGKVHAFADFSAYLVARYASIGDDPERVAAEGRLADLTKTAELYFDDAKFSGPCTIRDTPGVDDPFPVRRAAALRNISDIDICVIVLRADQRFGDDDIDLVRRLHKMAQKRIVIFVNGIDALQDPHHQISEIEKHIQSCLAKPGLPKGVPIIFGSAVWGAAAMTGMDFGRIPRASAEVLEKLVAARLAAVDDRAGQSVSKVNGAWHSPKKQDLSGLNELLQTVHTQASAHIVGPTVEKTRADALSIAKQSQTVLKKALKKGVLVADTVTFSAISAQLDTAYQTIDAAYDKIRLLCDDQIRYRISDIFYDFIRAESRNLTVYLEKSSNTADWAPEAEELQYKLIQAYHRMSRLALAHVRKTVQETTDGIASLYADLLLEDADLFPVIAPVIEAPATPLTYMKTMKVAPVSSKMPIGYFKRRRHDAQIKEFVMQAEAEMGRTIQELEGIYIRDFVKPAHASLLAFLAEHSRILENIARHGEAKLPVEKRVGVENEIKERLDALAAVEAELKQFALGAVAASGKAAEATLG